MRKTDKTEKEISKAKARTLGRLLTGLCSASVESFLPEYSAGEVDPKSDLKLLEEAKKETLKIAQELIDAGADVNEDVSKGKRNHVPSSPLILAARKEKTELAKLLLSNGATVGVAAMQAAAGTKNMKMLSLLLSHGGNPCHHGILEMPIHSWRSDFPDDEPPFHDTIVFCAESSPESPQTPEAIASIKLLLSHYKASELKNAMENPNLAQTTKDLVKKEMAKRKVKKIFQEGVCLE